MNKLDNITIGEAKQLASIFTATQPETCRHIGKFVVIRSRDSGCHAGFLLEKHGNEVVLKEAIRLWYWDGAFTLSQLATEGVTRPENCKFGMAVNEITVMGVCEIIPTTDQAEKSIHSVKACKR